MSCETAFKWGWLMSTEVAISGSPPLINPSPQAEEQKKIHSRHIKKEEEINFQKDSRIAAPFQCAQSPATHDEKIKRNVVDRLAYVFLRIPPVDLEHYCSLRKLFQPLISTAIIRKRGSCFSVVVKYPVTNFVTRIDCVLCPRRIK